MEQSVPLSVAPVGARITLAAPEPTSGSDMSDGSSARRLAQLGIRPGAEFVVVMRTSGGGRVVAVAGSRIALDQSTVQRLHVTSAPQDDDGDGTSQLIVGSGDGTSTLISVAGQSAPLAG